MAEAVLTIALETIRDLLVDEAKFLFGVRGEVEEIEIELKRMKVFLKDADAIQDEDKRILRRVEEIRELANEVEIVLETFAIEVMTSTKRREGVKDTLKRYACVCNKGVALHKVGSEIVRIKNKITTLTRSFQTYDLGQAQSSDSAQQKQLQQWQRQTDSLPEEDFVGMEEDIRQLVFHLVNNSGDENQRCPRVVSICGMGGLGKTSLAKKVYNHDQVRRYFDLFAWTCITQQCQPKDILQEILIGLTPLITPQNREEIMKMGGRELHEQLYRVQMNKKCLIVIDDIWSKEAWDSLRLTFPDGNKVLLTTRHEEVASHADPSGFLHKLECLNDEESWNLLKKKAFPRSDTEFIVHSDMEELGREMVKRCRGLPLAVVILGGILVRKHTSKEWEMVLQNIKTYVVKGEGIIGKEDGGGVSGVLALSYKNLPYQLKACFLYLGNFPEDAEIEAEKLYHLWVAERLVSSEDKLEGETMVDVAERYLGELAQRCMVQFYVKNNWRKICRLHDLMRELCLSKVKEENFLKKLMISSQENKPASSEENPTSFATNSSTKTRRLAIYCKNSKDDAFPMSLKEERCENVRSLLFFTVGEALSINTVIDNIKNFKLLRVLDLEGSVSGGELPETIGMLLQLQYFSLNETEIKKLPSCIEKLVYLQTLDLRVKLGLFIPNVLWKLERLRHLYLPPWGVNFDREHETKLRLGSLRYLETLVNFDSNAFEVRDLWELCNLRKLSAVVRAKIEDQRNLLTSITSKNSLLKQSEIEIRKGNFCSEEELIVLRKLLGCHHLVRLVLVVPISKLPEYNQFSLSLTLLRLYNSKLKKDFMPTLEKLPSLIRLAIGENAFMGKEMVCSEMGFPQLKLLSLYKLPNLESWRVDEGAFPKLSILRIDHCEKLKMIPDGLSFVTSLKQLTIYNSIQLIKRLRVVNREGGEDLYKVQHVPSITLG